MPRGDPLALRQRVETFLCSALGSGTQERYKKAVSDFTAECAADGLDLHQVADADLDYLLADRVVDYYEEHDGAQGLASAGVLLAAFQKSRPQHRFRVGWKAVDVWRVRCPPQQAPCFPAALALACVSWLTLARRIPEACAVLLCYTGLLRASEACNLRWKDVHAIDDQIVLLLGRTKRGLEQRVLLSHPATVAWMRRFMMMFACKDVDAHFTGCSYNRLARWLQKACDALGFGGVRWTSHGLRRGGATELMMQGMSLPDIMLRGRWLSERSCREYLRRGEVMMLRLRADIASESWQRLQVLASLGVSAFECDEPSG